MDDARIAFERQLLARAARGRTAVATRPDVLPASFGQERMWLSDWLDPDASTESTVFVIGLRGDLDVAALRGAVTDLTRRHEVLRTVVEAGKAGLVQRILPAAGVPLPATDFPDDPAAIEAFAREQLVRKLDLAAEPPVSWTLLRHAAGHHHLVLRMHHIACDGWSEGMLNRDLSQLYRARATGTPAGLPTLPLQYADFAIGQRERQSEAGLTYWRQRLAGVPPTVPLPFDHEPGTTGALESGTLFARIPGTVVDDLETVATAEGASVFMALLAAFAVTLWAGSGATDMIIGSPVAGRELPETEQLIGVFTNTLPMRVEVRPGESFRAMLRRVREGTLDDLAHGEVPFQRLVDVMRPARVPGRLPLVQVILQLDNTGFAEPAFPGVEVTYRQLFAEKSALDLTVSLGRRGPDYGTVWKYRSGLLDEATVRRVHDRFVEVLGRAGSRPGTAIGG